MEKVNERASFEPKTVTCECGALVADINQHACAFRPKNVRCECPAPGTSNSTVSPFCPMHADSVQPPVVGWQPISTAPKDGRRILAVGLGPVFIGSWGTGADIWMDATGAYRDPRFWMPLPEGPTLTKSPSRFDGDLLPAGDPDTGGRATKSKAKLCRRHIGPGQFCNLELQPYAGCPLHDRPAEGSAVGENDGL